MGSIPSFGFFQLTALFRLARLSRLARIRRLIGGQKRNALVRDLLDNRGQYATFITILAAGMVLCVSSILVLQFESRSPDANIKTGGDALWWAVVTITTVGYGDYFPVTTLGRLTGVSVMFAGVGIIGALASILASLLVPPPKRTEPEDDGRVVAAPPLTRRRQRATAPADRRSRAATRSSRSWRSSGPRSGRSRGDAAASPPRNRTAVPGEPANRSSRWRGRQTPPAAVPSTSNAALDLGGVQVDQDDARQERGAERRPEAGVEHHEERRDQGEHRQDDREQPAPGLERPQGAGRRDVDEADDDPHRAPEAPTRGDGRGREDPEEVEAQDAQPREDVVQPDHGAEEAEHRDQDRRILH